MGAADAWRISITGSCNVVSRSPDNSDGVSALGCLSN